MSDFQVSILKRDGTQSIFYATYTLAIPHAVSGDLIQIWADLNDQIVLKDKVDIWIMPGVVVNNTTTDIETKGPTITDKNIAVDCKIYGMGSIINTFDIGVTWYECIKISNSNSILSVECNYIEGIGKGTNPDEINGPCIYIENAKKFHLKCNEVYNHRNAGIWIGSSTNVVPDINLAIQKIKTGIHEGSNYYGNSALVTHGNGYININEIECSNLGHCFSHRGGTVIAKIKKLTSINNTSRYPAAVHMAQGTTSQKLILYFDEIQALKGVVTTSNSTSGIEISQGTGIFKGRKLYSKNGYAIEITGDNVKGSITCNEIISDFLSGVRIDLVNNQYLVNANFIKGYSYYGCIYAQSDANLLLKNAKLINTDTSTNSRCIVLEKNTTLNQIPVITINNVKAVTGNISGGSIFYQANFSGINIFNFGLFANKGLDANVSLKIGVGTNPMDPGYNYQCIIDPLLT